MKRRLPKEGERIHVKDPETGEVRRARIIGGEVVDEGPAKGNPAHVYETAKPKGPPPPMPAEPDDRYRYEVRDKDGIQRFECQTLRQALHLARIARNQPGGALKGTHVWSRDEQRIVHGPELVK